MSRISKLLIAIAALIVGIAAGVIWVIFNQQDFISEEEAHALVTERYGGSITGIETLDDDQYFSVVLESEGTTHDITLDRSDTSVQNIKTLSNTAEAPDEKNENSNETDTSSSDSNESTENNNNEAQLTLEDAEEAAMEEVGGETVYSTFNDESQVSEYYILQLIDGDDEGALVSVNSVTGDIDKVVWLEIDDDYEEIERLVHEAVEYADLYDQRYIEFDDDYFDD